MRVRNVPPVLPTYDGPSVQSVVSRTFGTDYRNTGSTPLWVNAIVSLPTGGAVYACSDATTTPATTVGSVTCGAVVGGISLQLSFVVLPANYYNINDLAGGATLGNVTLYQ